MVIPVLSWFRRRKPIPYMARPDVKAAVAAREAARARHAAHGDPVRQLTHTLLSDELGRPRLSVVRGGQG